jgi:hypothetical protein
MIRLDMIWWCGGACRPQIMTLVLIQRNQRRPTNVLTHLNELECTVESIHESSC